MILIFMVDGARAAISFCMRSAIPGNMVVGEVAASQVQTQDGVGQRVALVDGDGVRHAVAGVQHDAGGAAGGVEGEHGLDGHVHGGGVERLEHDLGHLLSVGLGVEGGLSKENGVLLGGDAQLVEKVWCQIFSMSSQLVTMPCSMGYLRVRMPLLDWASSPANPALHMPEPLSTTRAATSSSHMMIG